MDNIQGMVGGLSAAMREQRTAYHLTLGQLIAAVENEADQVDQWHVEFSDGGFPYGPRSYRGYYDDLAFERGGRRGEGITVQALLVLCQGVIGATMQGYKGGDYVMDERTALWRSEWGEASGEAIVGVTRDSTRRMLVLEWRQVDV